MKTFSDLFRKNLYACLIGPLEVIPATIIYALAFRFIAPEANRDNFELVPLVALIALIVAYPITLFVGLPLSIILQKYGNFNFRTLLAITLLLIFVYSLLSGAQFLEVALITYFSTFVVTGCWYLHRVG